VSTAPEVHSISGSRYLIYNAGRKQGQAETISECAANVRKAGGHYKARIANARKLAAEDGGEPVDWEELADALADNYGKIAEQIGMHEGKARSESMQLMGRGILLMKSEATPTRRPIWIVRVIQAFRAALRAA
jgi:hypothetical protein